MRLGRFVLILCIYGYVAWQVSESLGIALDLVSFSVGIFVAGLAGGTLFLISDWWSSVTRPYQPQVVKLQTKETPSQITTGALLALLKGILFILVVLAALIAGSRYVLP